MNLFASRINNLGTENAFKIGNDIRMCEDQGMKVIKLNLGEPDFTSSDNINTVAIEHIRNGNSHYTDPQGILSLRESIARQVQETREISIDSSQVIITPGVKPLISYTVLAYSNPGDEIIYPSPGYPVYESWITFTGAIPVPLHLKEEKNFRIDAADIEPLITPKTKIIFLNSPSNPTGSILGHENLKEIAAVIKKKGNPNIRIFSDEVYEKIIFGGKKHESIITLPDVTANTIMVSGHSKTYAMTGWRLGYAVLPSPEEAAVFKQLTINTVSCVPPFIQEAGKVALDIEENQKIAASMAQAFETRSVFAVDALNSIEGIRCLQPEGAFYVFPNITGICQQLNIFDIYQKLPSEKGNRTSPATLFQMFLLYRHGVATMDRRSFGVIGSEADHYLRLSTATDIASLKEGIKRIAAASKDSKGFMDFINENKHTY